MNINRGFFISAFCLALISFGEMQTPAQVRVNRLRIMQHIQALSEFGKNPQGGVGRIAYQH